MAAPSLVVALCVDRDAHDIFDLVDARCGDGRRAGNDEIPAVDLVCLRVDRVVEPVVVLDMVHDHVDELKRELR